MEETAPSTTDNTKHPFLTDPETPSTSGDAELKREAEEKFLSDEREDQWRWKLKQLNEGSKNADGAKREKSIFKVQKFVNKLKRFADTDKDALLADLAKLDVSMHLSEIGDAFCESALRLKDIPAVVEISSVLFQHYGIEFSRPFCLSLLKTFKHAASNLSALGSKRRSISRLAIELVLVSVCSESECLPGIFNELCDSTVPEEISQHNVGVIEMLCRKYDAAILGDAGIRQEALDAALGKSLTHKACFTKKAQLALRAKLIEFYRSNAQAGLIQADAGVRERSSTNQQRRINKGVVDGESEAKYQAVLAAFNRLQTHLTSLADVLRQPVPTLVATEDSMTRLQPDAGPRGSGEGEDAAPVISMWEDAAEKDFYENVLILSDAVPGSLLGLKERTGSGGGVSGEQQQQGGEDEKVVSATAAAAPAATTETHPAKSTSLSAAPAAAPGVADQEKSESIGVADKKNVLLDQFLSTLTQALTGTEVDQLSMKLFYDQLNVPKANRKRIVKFLLTTKRTDLYILPTLSRFVATVGPYCKDISVGVVDGVLNDLRELMVEKDPMKVESKMKAVRYLGELCKFRLVPPGTVMDTLNQLFENFSHHHAEMGCQLIQCCGKFLMCFPGTSTRFRNILDKMLRMKNVRNLPVHLEIMIEDTCYQLLPNERKIKERKQLPVVRQFINHLIHVELHRRPESQVLNSIRRLDWGNPDIPKWLRKAILDISEHVAFHHFGNVAALLSAIVPGRPEFVIQCIDDLLERIQLGMEREDFREGPRRVRQIKFAGELFNYRLFDTAMIFDLLYHLIGFGGPSSYGASDIQTLHRLVVVSGNGYLLLSSPSWDAHHHPFRSLTAGAGTVLIHGTQNRSKDNGSSDVRLSDTETLVPEEFHEASAAETLPVLSRTPRPLADPAEPPDPIGHYFRVRLVCLLLDTCGQYFRRGTSREKMDRFLLFFQRYLLLKLPLPMSIQYVVLDTIDKLRPKMKLISSVAEVDAVIATLLAADLRKGLNVGEEIVESLADGELEEIDDVESDGGRSESVVDGELRVAEEEEETTELNDDNEDDENNSDDEDGDDDEDEEEEEEREEEDDEDQVGHHRETTTFEDELFDLQLNELLTESLQEAKATRARVPNLMDELRLPPKLEIPPPSHLSEAPPVPDNKLRICLVTRKGHKGVQLKSFDIPKGTRLSSVVLNKETEDAEEHAQMKQFVLDSVSRIHKQEVADQQDQLRQELFVPTGRRFQSGRVGPLLTSECRGLPRRGGQTLGRSFGGSHDMGRDSPGTLRWTPINQRRMRHHEKGDTSS